MTTPQTATRFTIFACIIIALIIGYVALARTGAVSFLQDGVALKQWIQALGVVGPLVIIGLMIVAIIMSPIPSAPIALAAGAVYGHMAGAIYVAIGAELGAIIAFYIARLIAL